jgi:hypothetical protein
MSARSLVFNVSDTIRGWGRLVRTSEGDWFDPPLPVPLAAGGWSRPVPPPSEYAIPIDDADFDAIAFKVERDGVIEGHVGLVGRWLGDRIQVRHQSTNLPERPLPEWLTPPCPAPAAGWPHSSDQYPNPHADLGELKQTGAAVMVTVFRPSPRQAVLVVAAADIPAVEAQLRLQLPDRLCVVPSRCTGAHVEATQQHVLDTWQRWGVYGCGQTSDQQGQAVVTVDLVRVTDEIADWADAQLTGLVELEPCLSPTSDDRP